MSLSSMCMLCAQEGFAKNVIVEVDDLCELAIMHLVFLLKLLKQSFYLNKAFYFKPTAQC